VIVCSGAINNTPSEQTVTELCSGLRPHTPGLAIQEGHNIVAASGGTIVVHQLVSYSGSANAKLIVVLHYPLVKSKTANFGDILDLDNGCLGLLVLQTSKKPPILPTHDLFHIS
jgi:hypothetical protein